MRRGRASRRVRIKQGNEWAEVATGQTSSDHWSVSFRCSSRCHDSLVAASCPTAGSNLFSARSLSTRCTAWTYLFRPWHILVLAAFPTIVTWNIVVACAISCTKLDISKSVHGPLCTSNVLGCLLSNADWTERCQFWGRLVESRQARCGFSDKITNG